MDKLYLNMFGLYASLSSELEQVGCLSNENMAKLENHIKTFIDDGDDSDSSGGTESTFMVSEFLLNGDCEKIIALLLKMQKKCKNPSKKRKLSNLIAQIKENVEDAQEQISSATKTEERIFIPEEYEKNHHEEMQRKYSNYALFALNRSLNKDYFPTKEVSINTSSLSSLSREDLMTYFDSDVFYDLNQSQVLALLQAVSNEFLISNGTSPCAVIPADLTFNDHVITFGEYDPNVGAIYINKNVLNLFEVAKKTKDQYFPYQIVSTLIHESEHRNQFYKLIHGAVNQKDYDVLIDLKKPNHLSYSSYLSSLDELDARNASLEYFRKLALKTNNQALVQFYNENKIEEMKKPKNTVSGKVEGYFPDIYDRSLLNSQGPSILSKNNFKSIIQDSLEYGKAL